MDQLNFGVWRKFVAIAKPYWFSEDKIRARVMLGILLLLLLAVNGLNIVISYVGADFMTALSSKDAPKFWKLLTIYGGVFVVGTPIVVYYSWVQQKLGMSWRKWMTETLLQKYFHNRAYYHISSDSRIDNPDERMHQDVSAFTNAALSFLLTIISSVITLVSFSAILWSISTNLVIALLVYSIAGTIATIWFGKRLIGLNFNQLRREADFRFGLVHVRSHVESIAFYKGEEHETGQIKKRFQALLDNFNNLIGWQRNVNFLTTGYNYFVVIIPSLVIAPLYFAGKVKFGAITQADMAFSQVLASLSIIVLQFQELSAFVAQTNRLGAFQDALESPREHKPSQRIIDFQPDTTVTLEGLTVDTPDFKRTLVKDLSCSLKAGGSLLIVGPSGVGKSSVLRTIAGLWDSGTGLVSKPKEGMLFLPQRPYMVLGSLRSQLIYPNPEQSVTDEQLYAVLSAVNLGDLAKKVGGLDADVNWSDFLSMGEQQRLAFARLLLAQPKYAVLDEATSALDSANEERLYRELRKTDTTFISVGHRQSLFKYHQHVLQINGDTTWKLMAVPEQSVSVAAVADVSAISA